MLRRPRNTALALAAVVTIALAVALVALLSGSSRQQLLPGRAFPVLPRR